MLTHIGSSLILSNKIVAIDKDTKALFHLNDHAVSTNSIFPNMNAYDTRSDGKFGNAIAMDGTMFIQYGNNNEKIVSLLTGTISFWFKFDSFNTDGTFFRLRQAPTAEMTYSKDKIITWKPYGATDSIYFQTLKNVGDFAYYTLTWDNNGNCSIYEDGNLKISKAITADKSGTYDDNIYIGNTSDQGTVGAIGLYNELKFDGIVRTRDEILQWYLSDAPFHDSNEIITI
ncbi:MAG TPA: LamG-like jellyroll fold domain-containing protein [Pseudoneobacillus sp.]|jgi:hypothetical protein|nr:LamG-like jellyroll fold domain-containing protein [Pseudoneobacillus sp.]